ncbi:glycoside hydrolase family 5 protein [Zunongwangia sp. H14]|uniref:glycoside hydrolase family 5 protein n=1 Tax=Zunongwangia sp. H14 TaxID=3240792 RepID=UPI00356A0878
MKTKYQLSLLLFHLLFMISCSVAQENDSATPEMGQEEQITEEENFPNEEEEEEEEEEGSISNGNFVSEHGQLHIEGNKLLDKNNDDIQLRGMSLFWSQWEPEFYNYETIKNLTEDWNITVIRAAMAVENGGYLENPEKEKQKIYDVIDAAIAMGIYVIVDWHDHHAHEHQEAAVNFFTELAEKYGSTPNLLYETFNEPMEVSWSDVLKPYHTAVITAIRAEDPDNVIICGTPRWSQRVDLAAKDPLNFENIAYTLHYYAATHKADLREVARQAINNGLPIFITEFGTTKANGDEIVDKEESVIWWDFAKENNLSWCNWSIADKDEKSAALLPGTTPEDLKEPEVLTESGKIVKERLKEEE